MIESRRGPRVVAVLALLVIVVALVALDISRVRMHSSRARDAMSDGLDALQRGDAVVATRRFDEVRHHVSAAASATHGVGWRVAATMPGVSDDLHMAATAVDAAVEATTVVAVIVDAVGALEATGGRTRLRDEQGNLDMAPLGAVADQLGRLDLAPLKERLDALAALPESGAAGVVANGRQEVLLEGRRLLDVARDVRVMAGVLPTFLGIEETREYFLAMQNVAEGRGTGGLIGFFATVRIGPDGIELTSPERYEVLDQSVAEGPLPPIGVDELPAGYLARYGQFDPTTFLANANLDPDFPTVARVLLNLYEKQRGRRLDGVIAMDPIALAYAHVAIGPVELPDDLFTGGLPHSIPAAQLPRILMVDAYDVLGGPSEERKTYLAQVAQSAFGGVTSGEWSALAMARWLAVASDRRHLQLYSEIQEEQAAFEQLDLAGRFAVPPDHDLLAVTFNNSGGNKMDVHVGHTVTGEIRLDAKGERLRREAELTVTVDNPLASSGRDIYIIGTHRPNQGFVEFFTDTAGLNRTWFTVWAPQDVEQVGVIDADGRAVATPREHRLHGMVAVDHVLETPSEERRSFTATVAGPAPADARPDGSLVYRLVLPRQSKGVPDRLDLLVVAPEGWRLEQMAFEAGSQDAPTFGVHGEAGPAVTAQGEGPHLRLRGDRSRDVVLHVRIVPDRS